MLVLNLSLEKEIFVGDPKIARVTSLLKVGHKKKNSKLQASLNSSMHFF